MREKSIRYEWLNRLRSMGDVGLNEDDWYVAKSEYEEALEEQTKMTKEASRMQEISCREKPMRFFCNLLKNQSMQRYIPKLIDDNNVPTSSQEEVNDRI